ncbi:MAG: hypothetical protein JO307_23770, partial [Bryobacterales bacterium]|nr:hypothetical protein [Bryobacterales bacterium]
LNVWLALSVAGHSHNSEAWRWFDFVAGDVRLVFCRYTQIGFLRLLTNSAVMGKETLTLQKAWTIYENWLQDTRVDYYPEPRGMDLAFREATAPFAAQTASKWIGDCYLLAYAKQSDATLVTFDRALLRLAKQQGYPAITPL